MNSNRIPLRHRLFSNDIHIYGTITLLYAKKILESWVRHGTASYKSCCTHEPPSAYSTGGMGCPSNLPLPTSLLTTESCCAGKPCITSCSPMVPLDSLVPSTTGCFCIHHGLFRTNQLRAFPATQLIGAAKSPANLRHRVCHSAIADRNYGTRRATLTNGFLQSMLLTTRELWTSAYPFHG